MVHHLVVAAELRVLVGECVEAVGALRDDLLDAHAVERLDVLAGEHLEQVLVARAASRVAGAVLGRTENGEVDAGTLQQLRHGLGDLLVLVVEGTGTADPVEVLGFERLAAVDDVDAFDAVGPVGPFALGHPHGLAEFSIDR